MSPIQAAVLGTVQGSDRVPSDLEQRPPVRGARRCSAGRTPASRFDVGAPLGHAARPAARRSGRDWWKLARCGASMPTPAVAARRAAPGSSSIVASVPAAIAGVLLQDAAETRLRSLPLQAAHAVRCSASCCWWVDAIARGRESARRLQATPGGARARDGHRPGAGAGARRLALGDHDHRRPRVWPGASRRARFSFLLATPITLRGRRCSSCGTCRTTCRPTTLRDRCRHRGRHRVLSPSVASSAGWAAPGSACSSPTASRSPPLTRRPWPRAAASRSGCCRPRPCGVIRSGEVAVEPVAQRRSARGGAATSPPPPSGRASRPPRRSTAPRCRAA